MFGSTNLQITKFDYDRLIQIIHNHKNTYSNTSNNPVGILSKKICSAKKIDSKKIPSDHVTMNSKIKLVNLGNPQSCVMTLVFPDDADSENGKISILSEIGASVFGYRIGDVIKCKNKNEEKYLQIEQILYQPEAAGDYHL